MESTKEERIQKLLANYGNFSRREAERLILSKRVKKNNEIVKIGDKATINDNIFIDDKKIKLTLKHDYFLVNKPKGYICSRNDSLNKTVISLVDNNNSLRNLFTIGRLDVLTTGLIIVTNDGYLSNKITTPKNKIKKTYLVWVDKRLTLGEINKLSKGITLEDGYKTKPLVNFKTINNKDKPLFKLVLTEGKNNQIRKMFKSLDKNVVNLKRISIGNIHLDDLPLGGYKKISKSKIYELLNISF